MARVTYGSGVTELAGSIGGVTFQKNASGNIAKLRANPVVNPSSLQAGYQTGLAKLVSLWPTLTQLQKDNWNVLAAAHDHTTPWGETKTLSGYQWFMTLNLNLIASGQSVITTVPVWDAVSPPSDFSFVMAADTFSIDMDTAWDLTTHYGIAYCTLPLRQSSIKLRRSLFITRVLHGISYNVWALKAYFETLANVTWAQFYGSADCSIIVRLKQIQDNTGFASSYRSGIIKI